MDNKEIWVLASMDKEKAINIKQTILNVTHSMSKPVTICCNVKVGPYFVAVSFR